MCPLPPGQAPWDSSALFEIVWCSYLPLINIVHLHCTQVGNAVPPPLACALGKQLRVVLEATRSERIRAAMAAQW